MLWQITRYSIFVYLCGHSTMVSTRIRFYTGRRDDGMTGWQDDRMTGWRDDGTRGRGDKGTRGREDEGTRGRWDDGTTGRRDDGTTGRRDDGTTIPLPIYVYSISPSRSRYSWSHNYVRITQFKEFQHFSTISCYLFHNVVSSIPMYTYLPSHHNLIHE